MVGVWHCVGGAGLPVVLSAAVFSGKSEDFLSSAFCFNYVYVYREV